MPIAVLLLVACQYDPFAHEYTTRKPVEDTLIGRYVPDDESRERLRGRFKIELGSSSELLLRSDRTFLATHLPRCWSDVSDCVPGWEDWEGTWSLEQDQRWWAAGLHILSRNGKPENYRMPATLRGNAPPYILHLTIGDPDSGDALAFRRDPATSR